MRVQDYVVRTTQRALNDVLRAVDALPEDKIEWSPNETARSALSQLQEIAISPAFYVSILKEGKVPDFSDHANEKMAEMRASVATLASCRTAAMEQTAELCRLISEFPDSRLDEEITLPFGGGMVVTMAGLLGLHSWNMIYHYGQICYLQTMLGDMEMP
jgi:uncharacterized damage-inducible protein DinB